MSANVGVVGKCRQMSANVGVLQIYAKIFSLDSILLIHIAIMYIINIEDMKRLPGVLHILVFESVVFTLISNICQ